MSHIIIIGGGACGLMAASELLKKDQQVTLLEARDRLGGRIHTIHNNGFIKPVEAGAEFIHGHLRVTIKLLRQAGIEYHPMEGRPYEFSKGKLEPSSFITEGWDVMINQLMHLEHDMTVSDFLDRYFGGKDYESLRERVIQFASGYDAADPEKAGIFSLRDEWLSEDSEEQYRLEGGYGRMIEFLAKEVEAAGGTILLSSVVKKIEWKPGNVSVMTAEGKTFSGEQVLVTVPIGILREPETNRGAIEFIPAIPEKIGACRMMGYGSIVKILLQFDQPFWMHHPADSPDHHVTRDMSFIFSKEKIPTWWTQHPDTLPLLTGWLGGPSAEKLKDVHGDSILEVALTSLSNIFHLDKKDLQRRLTAHEIANWSNDIFSQGAYGYDTIQSAEARKELNNPVEETIFFAGEALYEGTEKGTVEAALVSGEEAAKKILQSARW